MSESVLIVGVGQGLSASLARLFSSKRMKVVLSARNLDKLADLKKEINAETVECDSSNVESVKKLFEETDNKIGTPNLVIYNASWRPSRNSIADLDPDEVRKAINVTTFGAFLVAREATKRTLRKNTGTGTKLPSFRKFSNNSY